MNTETSVILLYTNNEYVKSEIKDIIYDYCKENEILRYHLNPIWDLFFEYYETDERNQKRRK